jgi:hypothetical protein
METSNNKQATDCTIENTNNLLIPSSPNISEANYDNLDTFDFDAFFAEENNALSLAACSTTLQDIDFAADEQAFRENAAFHSSFFPTEPKCPETSPFYPGINFNNSGSMGPTELKANITQQHADEWPLMCNTPRFGGFHDNLYKLRQDRDPWEQPSHPASQNNEVLFPVRRTGSSNSISNTKTKNTRTLNIATFDPSLFYQPLSESPRSWRPPAYAYSPFEYTGYGELDPQCEFSREQIRDYLTYHPLHMLYSSSPSTKKSGLKLWIQTTPADARKRYPTNLSSKCRFADCPAPNRTIRNGQFRVAFDEQSVFSQQLDPYHNAGHVHLFCIEKHFDFPLMCKRFNIQGDDRKFLEGRNKMAITRDHPGMLEIVNDFIQSSVPWDDKRPENWYDHSLCLALTKHHLRHQPKLRQLVRDARSGNSLDRHFNNLDAMVGLGKSIRERKASEKKRLRALKKRK